jgi:alpha-1,2-glucosyltransferase
VALALFGVVLLWAARRELPILADFVSSFRGAGLTAAVLCLCVGFAFFYDNGQAVDENNHYDQIVRLASGNWSMNPTLTMLPGFHALVAALVSVTGGVSEFSVRVTVFALSLATVGVFYALATRIEPSCAGMRTLQFTLLPILFPQFFLIYTDVTSVLFVLSMMLAAEDRRYWLAGGLGLVACLVRQDNVIWLAFVVLWSYQRDQGWTWTPIAQTLTRYSTFVATGVVFLLLVAANHGQVALGDDAGSHPLRSLYLTNIFFLMFLSSILFLPLWWGYRREFLERLRSRWLWLALLGVLPVFWLGFVNDHPHNTERADYFLRNAILIYFSSTAVRKLLFFIPVAIAVIGFAAVPMKRAWWLIYPFTILFLLPEWLVEQRYYLIPLTLFMLGRESSSPRSERLQTMLFFAGSAGLFMMVERSWGWM